MIFGVDNRVKISSSAASLTGSYVQIISVYADGYATQSSGVMIGSNDVLTAAHAIYDTSHQGYATEVTVIPSRFGNYEPYSSIKADNLFVNNSWISSSSSLGDYGVISLSTPIGFESGWMDYSSLTAPSSLLQGQTLTSYGYPGDLNSGNWLYSTSGTVDNIFNNYILQFSDDMDAYFGQSGSPIIQNNTVIGLISSQTETYNNILSLNSFSYQEISTWAALNNDQLPSSSIHLSLKESITGLYVAFFNRAPDAEGLNFWLNEASNLSSQKDVTKTIAALFATQELFTSTYTNMDNQTFINAIYVNILGSSGDSEGLKYWSSILDSGYSRASIVDDIVTASLEANLQSQTFADLSYSDYYAASTRQDTFTNKVAVALDFTATLDTSTNITNPEYLAQDKAYTASQKIILHVTADTATVQTAISYIGLAQSSSTPMEDINVWIS